eukprot:TRINITY_DN46123_c0_g1_i1.p1 TRINITY_DN46123_c0_g1~~TRINITY_DN46123_c0_g1_i1.p1  ORF type:complete len:164 (+),score=47.94 TRINITY_DN46123_c0_g1_i1:177-668(+)
MCIRDSGSGGQQVRGSTLPQPQTASSSATTTLSPSQLLGLESDATAWTVTKGEKRDLDQRIESLEGLEMRLATVLSVSRITAPEPDDALTALALVHLTRPRTDHAEDTLSFKKKCRAARIFTKGNVVDVLRQNPVSYTHLRAHETPEHLVCRLLLEKKKKMKK